MIDSEISNEVRDLKLMQAQSLPLEDQCYVVANLLGYREYPVDIDTFMDDPYYMGKISKNLYPFWREVLRDVFPSPIHTSTPILVFTGAIGTGKSTAVRFMSEYMKYRLLCLKDVYETCNFVPGKNIKFSWFHKTGALAQTDFVDVIDKWEEVSPYFVEEINSGKTSIFENSCDSIRSNNNIGSDVIFFNYSELNFIPYDRAHEKLDQGLKRWTSRYEMLLKYFGLCIIDTSAQGDDSIADNFIASNPYGDRVRSIYTNRWTVREHLHYYGQSGWFKVYIGDSTHQPFIVKDEIQLSSELDPDRFIDVPEECRGDFEFDLITALQDIAGVSVSKSDKFIVYPEKIRARAVLPQYSDNVVKFDFYDKTDKLIYRFDRSIRTIPSDRIIFIRFDTAVTGDNCGLAISYFDRWKSYEIGSKVKIPLIKVPLAVGISRYDEQETSLDHLYEFILDLNNRFEIGDVSFDQYQSRMILQNLTRDKIPNRYLSVDRTDEAYIYLKTLAYNGGLELPLNELLLTEICELKRIGNKCDHPSTGSKDISDAVAGCVFDLYQNIELAGQLSNKYKVTQYAKQIEDRSKSSNSVFQDMIQGIYGG